jgi:primosomal protein N' (replication factor Y)
MTEVTEQPRWVNVLVDYGGQPGLYTYSVPADMAVQPGDILTVPWRQQVIGAIALEVLTTPPSTVSIHQIRAIDSILKRRFFSKEYWRLLQQVADYYQAPLIQVVKTALPPGLLARSQRRLRLCPDQVPQQVDARLSPGVAQLLAALQQSATGDYTWQYLQRRGIGSYRAIHQLVQLGWAESYLAPPQPPRPKQRQAVSVICTDLASRDDLTTRQVEILKTLQRHGGELWLGDALQLCKTTSTTLKRLATAGCLVLEPREVLRTAHSPAQAADQPKALTPAQATALQSIPTQTGAVQILLHGVTGSGKTEVYLQAIAPYLKQRKSVLVLVPEIGLTPQLTDRFTRRFGDRVCIYHSALSDGERYDTWRKTLQNDSPMVIVGTRSAIFLPLANLGMIILDEEHDSSYKQDVTPCYHARTVARWRSQLENCPLVLGSATPSLETWVQCCPLPVDTQGTNPETIPAIPQADQHIDAHPTHQEGPGLMHRHRQPEASLLPSLYISLPERVQARPFPTVEVVDMREELQAGNRSILSRRLQTALNQMKAEGNQGLLFIHRRGHSSFVSCRSCGFVMMCPHCDVSLAFHQPHAHSAMTLRCHYCGHSQGHPLNCPDCGSPYLKHFGSGTQRVVNALGERFPDLSCIRFDSDTTRTKGAHRALLTRFAEGEADLLVGTQMLTKGIDLPQVTLVGIIAADGLLYMNDYWASERALQMLIQVAGRAGRGTQPGQVILQTYTPEHPVIEAVQQHNYSEFIETEWDQRQLLKYPPAGRLVLLRLGGPDAAQVQQVAGAISTQTQNLLQDIPHEVLGPAPAPIVRVARRYRWHILLKFPEGQAIPSLMSLKQQCPKEINLTIDVDPLNLA